MSKIISFQYSENQKQFHYEKKYNHIPKGWIELGEDESHELAHKFTLDFYRGNFSDTSAKYVLNEWLNFKRRSEIKLN